MATSGTITGTVTGNSLIKSKITWTENSYSVANNTSNVTVKLIYYRTDSQTTYGTGSWVLNINGTKYTGTSQKSISHSEVEVFSQTVTITHDSNGAKTFSMNASGSKIPGTSLEGTNCSGTGTLTTIPRASTFNSVNSSVDLGGTLSLSITAKSANFYHKFTFKCGNATPIEFMPGKVSTTDEKTYTYTIPTTDWANQIPNATSKTVSVTMQTCSNEACTTNVGSAVTKNFTVKVPNSGAYLPSVSLTTTLGNATNIASTYVQGKTSVTLSASSGKAGTGATIKSYTFKRASTVLKTVTTANATASASETTNTFGSVNYYVTITDSRGRTKIVSKSITVYEYAQPSLTINQCYRSNQDGTKNATSGTYINIKATFSCSTVNNKNSITTRTVQYKEASESSYSGSATNLTSGTASILGNGTIEKNKAYTVLVTITDTIGTTVTRTITIPTIFVTMDFKAGGTGVAFGKIADTDGILDVGLNMRVNSITTNEAKIDFLASNFNTRSILHSGYGNFGFYDLTDKAWLMRFNTSKNCVIPSGKFSAPKSIVMGSVSITPTAANTPTGVPVNLGTMAGTPRVVATPATTVPGKEITGVGVGSATASSVTIYLTRTNTTVTSVNYIAMCV